jgi:parvulin-like peptidyl-prolyl isomerase
VDRLSVRYGPEVREILIEETLLQQEAKRRKIAASPAEVNAAVERAFQENVRRYGSEQRLADELARSRGWSTTDYRSVIRAQAQPQVLREKLAAALVKESDVTDAQISEAYEARRAAFRQPDAVRISHILVRRAGEADSPKDREAKAKAEQALQRVKANPASFEQVAKETSEDRVTGDKGGVVPTDILRGANPFGSAFEAAVFPASVGVVGEIIASPAGYHVVRVDSKREGRDVPLDEVKGQLRTALLAERRAQAIDELMVRLRSQAKVETGKF